jgi:hypothetical protein
MLGANVRMAPREDVEMIELLPCPFCLKDKPKLLQHHTVSWIQCTRCDAKGPASPDFKRAIELWNTRLTVPLKKSRVCNPKSES